MTSFGVPGCPPAKYTLEECSINGQVLFTDSDFSVETAGNADKIYPVGEIAPFASLFETGKNWVYEKREHDYSTSLDKVSTFSVDVVGIDMAGERECWRLHRICRETGEESDIFVREDAGRVYLYNPITDGFALLMDFSYDMDYIVLEEVHVIDQSDVVKICGKDVKCLRISLMKSKAVDYWVEGVGSRNFSFLTYVDGDDVGESDSFRMLECGYNGDKLFGYDDFDNGAGSVSLIEDAEIESEKLLYDVSGRAVVDPRKGNVYIKVGQKVTY